MSRAPLPEWLSAYPELNSIDDPAWCTLISQAKPITIPPHTTLFHDGDSCSQYVLVLDGSIRVQKITESGREIVLYRVASGQTCILTTSCLLASEHYPAEGVTETEVKAVSLPVKQFHETLSQSTGFRKFVFSVYSQRIADLIRSAERFVCYAGPGVQLAPAQPMAEAAGPHGGEDHLRKRFSRPHTEGS